jgi:hypothetical protein
LLVSKSYAGRKARAPQQPLSNEGLIIIGGRGIPGKKSVIALYEIQLAFPDTVFIGIHRKHACIAMTNV